MPAGDVAKLRQADTVVLVPLNLRGVAVGLDEDFPNQTNGNVVAANLDVSFEEMEAFLEEKETDYQVQLNGVDRGAESVPRVLPHGEVYYRPDRNEPTRILAQANDRQVVRSPFGPDRFRAEGWAYRGRGVILYPDSPRHVISRLYPKGVFEVPDPILALRVPPRYLPREVRADAEARQSRERVAEYGAALVFSAVFVGGIVAGWFIRRRVTRDGETTRRRHRSKVISGK